MASAARKQTRTVARRLTSVCQYCPMGLSKRLRRRSTVESPSWRWEWSGRRRLELEQEGRIDQDAVALGDGDVPLEVADALALDHDRAARVVGQVADLAQQVEDAGRAGQALHPRPADLAEDPNLHVVVGRHLDQDLGAADVAGAQDLAEPGLELVD